MGVREDRIADLEKELKLLDKPLKENLAEQEHLDQEIKANQIQTQALVVEVTIRELAQTKLDVIGLSTGKLIARASDVARAVQQLQAQKRVAEAQLKALQELKP